MYLTNLTISSNVNGSNIRSIDFHEHLNLIIDEGKNQQTGSGNDIGKTTFLRCIDFCLGAKKDELYFDRDEKKLNKETFEFLVTKQIIFSLSVGKKIGETDYVLKRWFTGVDRNGKPVVKQSINNDDEIGVREYTTKLNKIFFSLESSKPSFRDLIPKFIREENNSTGSLLRYLGSFKSDEEYNSIHLILFGFQDVSLLSTKSDIVQRIKELENKKKVYTSDYGDENAIRSQVAVLRNDIDEFESKRDKLQRELLDISNLETDLDTLNEIAKEISIKNSYITKLEIDINNIKDNIVRLQNEKADVDIRSMELLYKETKLYNEKIHKDFNEIVSFHNTMIDNKLHFMRTVFEMKQKKIERAKTQRKELIDKYELFKNGKENNMLEELNSINEDIIKLSGHLEMLQSVLKLLSEINDELIRLKKELDSLIQKLEKEKEALQRNINIFNRYFSKFTKQLYGEEYYIYLGDDLLKPFEINAKFNPGDGKKKALITAFDLAYAAFISEASLPYPKFIAEDQLELVDIQQLETLFGIAKTVDAQLIIPVLQSKIRGIKTISQSDILLELSEDRKFFKF